MACLGRRRALGMLTPVESDLAFDRQSHWAA